jgi:hypothetical protein
MEITKDVNGRSDDTMIIRSVILVLLPTNMDCLALKES